MKTYILSFIFMLLSSVMYGQSELVVELTTDNYASETSWKVFDTNKNLIQIKNGLESKTTYFDTIQLDEAKCYYWTIYDSYGDGMSSPGSPGYFKIYYNGNIVAESQDANFGDSISVYGLGENCANYDVSIESITSSDTQSFCSFSLSFEVLNFGSELVTEIEASYSINGTNIQTVQINDLHIEFGTSSIISFPEMLQIKEAGSYSMNIEILSINGISDEDVSNNSIDSEIEIMDGYWKKPVHEEFTANWCAPCAAANPILDGVLDQYPNQYSLIKYQYINDMYYTAHGGNMASFYGVNGIPSLHINGSYLYPGDYTTEAFEKNIGQVTDINLTVDSKAVGDSVFATISIESAKNMNRDGYLRLAVVENKTVGNIGTNGEQEFFKVFMRFLTDWQGDNFGTLQAGETININYSGTMAYTFVEEMSDLSIVAYVFYKDTYEILQSEMEIIPYTPAAPTITYNIENNAVNVDTNIVIEISSNQSLVNMDGSIITDFSSIIDFNLEPESTNAINFNASISDDNKNIYLTPENSLLPDSKYSVTLYNVMSNEGVLVENSTLLFETQAALAIESDMQSVIEIYPNPVEDILTIESEVETKIRVINIAGIVLLDSKFSGAINLYVADFTSGIYFIETTIKNKTQLYKLTKN